MQPSLLQEATRLRDSGLSLLPIALDGTKAPDGRLLPRDAANKAIWTPYKERLPNDAELARWFGNGPMGVAVVAGQVSGNLEDIDFDEEAVFHAWREIIKAQAPALLKRLVLIRTPRPGYAVWYRCDEAPPGNRKLARGERADPETGEIKVKTLIETRAEGGYAIIPPSPGACHPSGNTYRLLHGDLGQLPVISAADRDLLIETAQSLNEYVEPEKARKESHQTAAGDRPGDEFNARGSWSELLSRHGWQFVRERGDAQYWRRPGKEHGISASLGHVAPGLFYVFSSNAPPFAEEHGYTLFTAYALLEHQGDFRAAGKELFARGYGVKRQDERQSTETAKQRTAPSAANNYGLGAIYSLADAEPLDLPDPVVIVNELVMEGFNLYAGKFKSGKSFFVLDLALSVALGRTALGGLPTRGGDVLYLALEDTMRRMKKRAARQLGKTPWPRRLQIAHRWPRVGEGGIADIRRWLDAHPEARLVIVDTLKMVKPTRQGNGNGASVYDMDYEFAADLKAVADEYAIGMVALTHTRKAEASDVFDTINASTGLGASADTIVVWERRRGSPFVKLHVTGRDIEKERVDDEALILQWNKDRWSWAYMPNGRDALLSAERRSIQEVIYDQQRPLTPKEVGDLIHKGAEATRQTMSRMAEKGDLVRIGYGRYNIPYGWTPSLSLSPHPERERE